MAGVQEFQKFMANDAQLKAFGNCINQVNLFSLDPDRPVSFNQRPNRVALVVVSLIFRFFNDLLLLKMLKHEKCRLEKITTVMCRALW